MLSLKVGLSWVILLLCAVVPSLINGRASTSKHSNNWAVLIDGSRYWFNYRHVANTLSIYHSVKRMGIPDSHIILMLADDMACNDRNIYKAQMIASRDSTASGIYDDEIEVDYRGLECNVENVLRVLTGRHYPNTPASKKLATDKNSNIFVYITGHGGDTFLKFHDKEEIQSQDLADAFSIMYSQGRYNEILFMVDTCQASTLYKEVKAPNIIGIGSSKLGQSSYSYHTDPDLGISLSDRFTYWVLRFFEGGLMKGEDDTLLSLFQSLTFDKLHSNAEWSTHLLRRPFRDVRITDFLSAITDVDLVFTTVNISNGDSEKSTFVDNTVVDDSESDYIMKLESDQCLLMAPNALQQSGFDPTAHTKVELSFFQSLLAENSVLNAAVVSQNLSLSMWSVLTANVFLITFLLSKLVY